MDIPTNNEVTISVPDEIKAPVITMLDNPQSNPQETPQVQTEAKKEEISTERPRVGRPCDLCDYKDEKLKTTQDYINSGKGEKPRMLYLNELAMLLGVYKDIVTDWKAKIKGDGSLEHPEFNRLVKELESMQEFRLQQRLMGRFNPTGAIFLLKTKHKYIETEKQILAGDKTEPLQIEFIPEKKIPDNE
jgi:hypothetical protein